MKVLSLVLVILLLPVSSPAAKDLQFPDIPGWKPSGDVQTFSPKTLYKYINGAADLYLASDFEELKVAEYVNENKASVVVEAYRHRTPRDAFGIYSQVESTQAMDGFAHQLDLETIVYPEYVFQRFAK